MQDTIGGRDLKARYYCDTRRANRSCDQPITSAVTIERQLVDFIAGFKLGAKRQFLHLIFDGAWLDDHRVVAVQPKPSFLPFFQQQRQRGARAAG